MVSGRRKMTVALLYHVRLYPECYKIFQMIRLKWLVISALLCAADVYSQSKWIRMQSPNFEAYSRAGERDTRDALRDFERVRDFFLQVNQREPPKPVPVYVVVFGSEKEYAPYRFNEAAVAYYFGSPDRDYIVMGRTGEQAARIAVPNTSTWWRATPDSSFLPGSTKAWPTCTPLCECRATRRWLAI